MRQLPTPTPRRRSRRRSRRPKEAIQASGRGKPPRCRKPFTFGRASREGRREGDEPTRPSSIAAPAAAVEGGPARSKTSQPPVPANSSREGRLARRRRRGGSARRSLRSGAVTMRGGTDHRNLTTAPTKAIDSPGSTPGCVDGSSQPDRSKTIADTIESPGTGHIRTPPGRRRASRRRPRRRFEAEKAKAAAASGAARSLEESRRRRPTPQLTTPGPRPPTAARKEFETQIDDRGGSGGCRGRGGIGGHGVADQLDDRQSSACGEAGDASRAAARTCSSHGITISYLKTLKASVRGVQSERDAQKLLKRQQYVLIHRILHHPTHPRPAHARGRDRTEASPRRGPGRGARGPRVHARLHRGAWRGGNSARP